MDWVDCIIQVNRSWQDTQEVLQLILPLPLQWFGGKGLLITVAVVS